MRALSAVTEIVISQPPKTVSLRRPSATAPYDDSMRNVKSQQPLSRPTDPREWHDVTLVKLKMIAPRLCARIED